MPTYYYSRAINERLAAAIPGATNTTPDDVSVSPTQSVAVSYAQDLDAYEKETLDNFFKDRGYMPLLGPPP
jgi:hypothetical protein